MGDEGVAKRDGSVQFKMKSVCSAKLIRALPCLTKLFPSLSWKSSRISLIDDGNGPLSAFQGRLFSASSSRACLLQVIADVQKGQICLNVKAWTSVLEREGVGGGIKTLRLQSTADVRSSADDGFFLSFSTKTLCHLLLSPTILCKKRATCGTVGESDDDCFYAALFSTLKQAHCACVWFYMGD